MTASVLVVAADVDRRAALAAALEPVFAVDRAEGGLDGLKRLREAAVDCVVASVDLPDLPVVGFVARLHDDRPALPVVLVGRPEDPDLAARARRAGAAAVVPSPDRLLEAVERAVADRQATEALDRHRRLERVLREVANAVASGNHSADIERAVYDSLVAADLYAFVCVGDYDPAAGSLTVTLPVAGTFPVASDAVPGDDRDHVFERAVETGAVAVADVPGTTRRTATRSADRSTGTLRMAAVPFVHDGTVHGVATVATASTAAFDASERALLQELGSLAGYALGQSAPGRRGKRPEFVENLVHELRSPLGVAMAHLDLGREGDDPESLERVEEALHQLEALIDDISKVAPLDTVAETTIRELGESATDAWEALDGPDAELVVEGSVPVVADHDLLERLLSNLFRNAVEHAEPDVTVRVGALRGGFFVEDDGPGIAPAERDLVFTRGYSTGDGSGVGLSLVREIAAAHGWTVDLGEGSAGGLRVEVTGVETGSDGRQTTG